MPRISWSKDKIIDELKRTRQKGPFTSPLLDAAARRHFGSLRAALEVAGLPYRQQPPSSLLWTPTSVIAAIRRRHCSGQPLESTHLQDPALYACSKRLFGSWSSALAAAGFPRHKTDYYTADEVRLRLIEHYEHELPLTSTSYNDPKLYRSAKKHFGGWRRAVESLGLGNELRREWTKQSVIEAILFRRAAGLSLYTTYQQDRGLFYAAVRRFGSWHLALQAAGINCRLPQRWSEEKIVQRLRHAAKTLTVRNLRKAQPNLVAAAHRQFGSFTKALEAADAESLSSRWTRPRIIHTIRSHYTSNKPKHLVGLGDLRLGVAARRHFGSWAQAVQAAGLADCLPVKQPRTVRSPSEVLAVIRKSFAKHRTCREMDKHHPGLDKDVRRHFGSWRRAVEAAGFECSRRRWSQEVILSEIKRRIANGWSLYSNDPNNINLAAAAARHFGSWQEALKAVGNESKRRQWSQELVLAEIKQRLENGASLNSNHPSNINLTAAAARYFGSWNAARQAAGVVIDQRKPRKAP